MDNIVLPNWPAPTNVKAFSSTRFGGVSTGVYQGLNLGMHVGMTAILSNVIVIFTSATSHANVSSLA